MAIDEIERTEMVQKPIDTLGEMPAATLMRCVYRGGGDVFATKDDLAALEERMRGYVGTATHAATVGSGTGRINSETTLVSKTNMPPSRTGEVRASAHASATTARHRRAVRHVREQTPPGPQVLRHPLRQRGGFAGPPLPSSARAPRPERADPS